jgi:hypothetical protein
MASRGNGTCGNWPRYLNSPHAHPAKHQAARWIESPESARERFNKELQRELPSGHVLQNKTLRAVAHSRQADDVLFEILGEETLAVVHLTHAVEHDPRWPKTELYANWQDWYKRRMSEDHRNHIFPDSPTELLDL